MNNNFITKSVSLFAAFGLTSFLFLSGCAIGPDYKRPSSAAPPQYKSEALGSWKEGQLLDHVPKGEWWEVFGDKKLNDLQHRAAEELPRSRGREPRNAPGRSRQRAIGRPATDCCRPTHQSPRRWLDRAGDFLPAQRTFKNHQSSDEGCEAHYDLSDTASRGVPLPDV